MRMKPMIALLVGAAVASACGESAPTAPESFSLPVQVQSVEGAASTAAHQGTSHRYNTHMSGSEEVPVRDTRAQGQATFTLAKDGASISYKLIVANIENVLMSHIHMAPAGVNGGIVVWLYPSLPPAVLIPGRFQGVLAEGVITADSLTGALAAQPLSALLDAMRAGNTYVNVHTSQFPPGEIRGQID